MQTGRRGVADSIVGWGGDRNKMAGMVTKYFTVSSSISYTQTKIENGIL